MAIIPNDSLAQGVVIDGILYYKGSGDNAIRLQKSNNNRAVGLSDKHPANQETVPPAKNRRGNQGRGVVSNAGVSGPAFTALDQQIVRLDMSYDQLPVKDPWLTYRNNIAGNWQLCANCQPDFAPKKLYRQYNFNRQLIGLAPVSAPIDDHEFSDVLTTSFTIDNAHGAPRVHWSGSPHVGMFWYMTAPVGLSLANPWVLLDGADLGGNFGATSPYYSFGETMFKALGMWTTSGLQVSSINMCQFTPTGAPGLQAPINLTLWQP